jgi:serine/threonine-protein kinase
MASGKRCSTLASRRLICDAVGNLCKPMPASEPPSSHDAVPTEGTTTQRVPVALVSQALVDAELARLAASAAFVRSPRHVRFLTHLAQAVMSGQTGRLREMALGVDVFYRSESRFDPRQDSIVRVEARRLRQKLAAYYAEHAQDTRLEFVLPVGSYLLEIRHRMPVPPAQRQRVALGVLPLSADALDPSLAALVPLLSAELQGALSRLNGLRVVAMAAPPSADAGADAAVQAAARAVGVDRMVRGSLSRQAEGVWQLLLQLLRVDDLQPLWSHHIRASDGDLMAALETLARGVITALYDEAAKRQLQRITLSGHMPMLPGLAAGAPTARTLEQLALARVAIRGNTPESTRKGAELCEQAIAAAPQSASACALLAEALLARVGLTVLPSLPTLAAARAAARRATEIDPGLADAHALLAVIDLALDFDWQRAEAGLLTALRLAPGSATVHARYGWLLMMDRRFAQAHACYAEARDLDPLSTRYRCHDALVSMYERDWATAAAGLDDVLDIEPQNLVALALRAALHLYTGELNAAQGSFEQLQQQFPAVSIGRCGLAQLHAMRGEHAAAEHALVQLKEVLSAGYLSPYQIAMVHARLAQWDETVLWLCKSAELRDFNFACVAVDPSFDALHQHPGYRQLLRDNGRAHLLSAPAASS